MLPSKFRTIFILRNQGSSPSRTTRRRGPVWFVGFIFGNLMPNRCPAKTNASTNFTSCTRPAGLMTSGPTIRIAGAPFSSEGRSALSAVAALPSASRPRSLYFSSSYNRPVSKIGYKNHLRNRQAAEVVWSHFDPQSSTNETKMFKNRPVFDPKITGHQKRAR